MKLFTYLTAQQRSWEDEDLRRFALKLRNVVAASGILAPQAAAALRQLIEYVSVEAQALAAALTRV